MKPREKVTNERASEYDIAVAFPSVTINKRKSMGMLWSAGKCI
jgi:hypothetical protein